MLLLDHPRCGAASCACWGAPWRLRTSAASWAPCGARWLPAPSLLLLLLLLLLLRLLLLDGQVSFIRHTPAIVGLLLLLLLLLLRR
jgi:hypothetical protein